jgi:exosortase/archaeosortase family protein
VLGINIKQLWQDVSEEQKTFLKRSIIAIFAWIILDSLVSIDNYLTNFVSYGSAFIANLLTVCDATIIKSQLVNNNITIDKISLVGCNTNIAIGHSCNGKAIIYLYTAFIIATAGYSINKKTFFCITGIILISIANVFRIAGLFIIKRDAPTWFDIAHKNIFQMLMYVIIIALWMLFLKKIPSTS